jgi:divalent metal cation (Fe/Co/Zn/Cd) transporter
VDRLVTPKPLDEIGVGLAVSIVASLVNSGVASLLLRVGRRSISGLMDSALPAEDRLSVQKVLKSREKDGLRFHALRTRQAGARKFISVHVLVPGDWTVHVGHQLLESIENDIRFVVPDATIFTHLEALDDPTSWDDETLDRVVLAPEQKD